MILVASGGERPMTRAANSQADLSHEPSHPLARAPEPLSLQFGMHARAAIHPSIGMVGYLNMLDELAISSAFADSSGAFAAASYPLTDTSSVSQSRLGSPGTPADGLR
jgi:hypothetical protein